MPKQPSLCSICETLLPPAVEELYTFPNITSDCRPWVAGRSVTICPHCGVAKRTLLPEAAATFANVYAHYEMFKHAQNATDQMNFNGQGVAEGRTQKILRFASEKMLMQPASVLDIGSGSGAGLIALAHQFPQANIYGFEPNDKPAERQKYLPQNVVAILNERPAGGEHYELVTLFHVFEHIEDLTESLAFIKSVLLPQGHVLIQVPYAMCGAFDFVIADHIWHFSKQSLVTLLNKAGFRMLYIGNEVIEKELTLVATPGEPVQYPLPDADEVSQALNAIQWLQQYKAFLDNVARREESVAIYGTGPAAAWAGHVMGERVCAYLDDDPSRVNATFNDKPVLSPRQIDRTLPVIAPFPDYQARWISERNQDLNVLLFESNYAEA